ncbi:MAG: preprotein translocase subunit SecA, partial [Anaerolineae bacterium]|nr:preprotein translocase subunit SecA [Anaerolineae bacterium]
THGAELYDVQLYAALMLCRGCIAQMQTGEGKTFVAIATAAHLSMAGRGVHVMTPNSYLADRDCRLAERALQPLGLSAGLTRDQASPSDKQAAYDCDITYGTGHEFGFDYLRDQLTLRTEDAARLGERLLRSLRESDNAAVSHRRTIQRGLSFAVVDEADSVMIDDAGSPLVLSVAADGAPPDLEAHRTARELADVLMSGKHFRLDSATGSLSLTAAGMDRCYADDVLVPAAVLQRPWTAYVEQALRAALLFRRNVHYVVSDQEVRIVDATTGRIFEDRSWQDGLHQAIEAKEQVPVQRESKTLASITYQHFFKQYEKLAGMTGTAATEAEEFEKIYNLEVISIPTNRDIQKKNKNDQVYYNQDAKWKAVVDYVGFYHRVGVPILIGTSSIQTSELVSNILNKMTLAHNVLNAKFHESEAHIVKNAGAKGSIVVATNMA